MSRRNRSVRLAGRGLLAMCAGVALVTGAGGSASADSYVIIKVVNSTKTAGSGEFKSSGDKLTVCDKRADGKAVNVGIYDTVTDDFVNDVKVSTGYGICETENYRNVNLVEGRTYRFYSDVGGTLSNSWSDKA
ncbi:hypothetical protein [Streptomyces werraensis]|uniref:hypothetical protein n=1 Tax=Streptomyces werraensis TaxID=68284 RepID=UPI0037FA822A